MDPTTKHIRDLTLKEVEKIIADLGEPKVVESPYNWTGPGAWAGKIGGPAQTWFSRNKTGPWQYTEEYHSIVEWMDGNSDEVYYLQQNPDGSFAFIEEQVYPD